jgi:hypothetical protein
MKLIQHIAEYIMFTVADQTLVPAFFCIVCKVNSLNALLLTDSDEIVGVFAGSALWLDCSTLVQPLESLIQVSWYREDELLYHQYWTNGHNIGYPSNSTSGFMFAARVTSRMVGQVTIWPVIPNEDGVYRCDVILADSTRGGHHSKRTKTFSVFVCKFVTLSVSTVPDFWIKFPVTI